MYGRRQTGAGKSQAILKQETPQGLGLMPFPEASPVTSCCGLLQYDYEIERVSQLACRRRKAGMSSKSS